MSEIKIECFEEGAEIISHLVDNSGFLTFKFNKGYNGFISVGDIDARIVGDSCRICLRGLADGVYTPKLMLCDRAMPLPTVRIENGAIIPIEKDSTDIRDLSIRERRLNERVKNLEAMVDNIYKRVFGTTIF